MPGIALGVTLAIAATQLTGCAQLAPSVPTMGGAGQAADDPLDDGADDVAVTPAPGTPLKKVSEAAQSTKVELGVQISWHDVKDPKLVRSNAARLLNYVVGLGANSVGITFPIYTDGYRPSKVYTQTGVTPTPTDLRVITTLAKERGLQVMIRPIIDETNISTVKDAWRGSIKPPDPDAWFASYSKAMVPFLKAAQAGRADTFVLATELDSLVKYDKQWRTALIAANKVYKGRLSYGDNWGSWQTGRPGVPLAEPGLDAYPQLDLTDGASVPEISKAWAKWLQKRPKELSKTVIQEIGIASTPGAYEQPAVWARENQTLQPQIQVNWFAGACAAAKELEMPGLYFWSLDVWAEPSKAKKAAGYNVGSFIGRGDKSIKQCFASGWPGQ
ncbi:hypothetical protein L3i22_107140 [Actinoplanes sp. L3-i22]|nr:hypothetical protein L3i22_107140 [Actinoplanes sp. L3-i22]